MDVYHNTRRPPPIPGTKKGKKSSKLRSAPVSFADVSPKSPRRNGQGKERFSGLWEFFYESDESGNGGGGGEVEREEGKLKNIRGFLFKRRKSPLKGWHKRYFTLQEGILTCSRNKVQMKKGKILSRTDLGFAVITCDSVRWKIDIDEERQVYHLKTKNASHFAAWSACLLAQEMWRKARLSGTEGGLDQLENGEDLDSVRECLEALGVCVKSPVQKLNNRSGDSGSEGGVTYTAQNSSEVTMGVVGGGGGGGGGGKEKRRWGRRRHDKKSSKDTTTANILFPEHQLSLPLLPANSLAMSEEAMEENILRDDFSSTATTVFAHFNEMLEKWDKLQAGFDECIVGERAERQQRQTLFTNQQLMLRQSLLQNTELKDRLSQIQALASGLGSPATASLVGPASLKTHDPVLRQPSPSLSPVPAEGVYPGSEVEGSPCRDSIRFCRSVRPCPRPSLTPWMMSKSHSRRRPDDQEERRREFTMRRKN
ncbi:Oxysterol-binding protein-related protein 6 [Geodia barretti]|uniref:Oxysterol-binding protein-related protein 6 n=1 Tax=Geodia barretti TaxID=519541 RepID=A0AA35T9N8_GEOBA|nr:Oxysterol-binding protein-related protein 6 [Geodia barretti]